MPSALGSQCAAGWLGGLVHPRGSTCDPAPPSPSAAALPCAQGCAWPGTRGVSSPRPHPCTCIITQSPICCVWCHTTSLDGWYQAKVSLLHSTAWVTKDAAAKPMPAGSSPQLYLPAHPVSGMASLSARLSSSGAPAASGSTPSAVSSALRRACSAGSR